MILQQKSRLHISQETSGSAIDVEYDNISEFRPRGQRLGGGVGMLCKQHVDDRKWDSSSQSRTMEDDVPLAQLDLGNS